MPAIMNGELSTKIAHVDLSDSIFRFVTLDSTGLRVSLSTTGDQAYGILQNAPEINEEAVIKVFGESQLETSSSGGIAVGAYMAPTVTTGIGIVATSGDLVRGIVTKPTTSDTGLVVVRLVDSTLAVA
ncbi:MAG TPA: hypothetical protein VMX17_16055 [Candidatus Glassbacteria bacterium]|nr:hypothetical protein [Candidatus Glassbacteria bacterium]